MFFLNTNSIKLVLFDKILRLIVITCLWPGYTQILGCEYTQVLCGLTNTALCKHAFKQLSALAFDVMTN